MILVPYKFESMIDINCTHLNELVTISKEDFDLLEKTVSWTITPMFQSRGRMAWQILRQPIKIKVGSQTIEYKSIKIKGVGAYNPISDIKFRDPIHKDVLSDPIKPTNTPLKSFVSYPHLGFDNDGNFKISYGDVAPIGGILYRKAVKEYNNAKHLIDNGIASILPLAVYRYENYLKFNGEYLGVVCCLSPMKYPYRLSEMQSGIALNRGSDSEKENFYKTILKNEKVTDFNNEKTALESIKKVASKIGISMRLFSLSGLYRYSAELSNFEYDSENAIPIFTDLDSTEKLNPLSYRLQKLEVLRDLCSLTYHFMAKFATPKALGKYHLNELIKSNPLYSLLEGYFDTENNIELEKETKKLWIFFAPHFVLLNRYSKEILNQWEVERRRSYKMNHHAYFILSMLLLEPFFSNSELGKKYSSSEINESFIDENAKTFLDKNTYKYIKTIQLT